MFTSSRYRLWPVALALSALALAGCSKDYGGARGGSAEPSVRSGGAEQPVEVKGPGSHGTRVVTASEGVSLKVRDALMTAKPPINWKDIRVVVEGNMVHLEGAVPNAQQSKQAEQLAKHAVQPDYTVMNMLTVSGGK